MKRTLRLFLASLVLLTAFICGAEAQTLGSVTTASGKNWTTTLAPDINDDFTNIYGTPFVTIGNQSIFSNERALAAGSLLGLTDGGANGNVTIAVTDIETLCIGNLVSAADKIPYFTGSGTCALADFSSAFRTFLTTSSSANFASVITDETGTNKVVYSDSPTLNSPSLVTPSLGVATATSINKVAITAPATSATITIPDGVTLTGPVASGTAMTLGNTETVTGAKTFGSSGAVGKFKLAGNTSGSTVVDASDVASGTITIPAATDTLVGKATTDTLTNKTLTTPVINGTPTGTGVSSTATASTLVLRDANANSTANNFLSGYTTTATAAGTTTLTVSSTEQQFFTGTTTQTVTMPVVSTLVLGQSWTVVNNSTGTVTVQSSGGNTILAITAGNTGIFNVISTSGTSAASWSFTYISSGAGTGTVTSVGCGAGLSGGTITTTGTCAVDINGLTEDTSPDVAADFVSTYDASAAGLKKVKLQNVSPPPNVQTFTASGTWNKPSGSFGLCDVEGWGAGGSGGHRNTTGSASGGGGGAYVRRNLPFSSLGSTETVTIGAGGTAVSGADANGNAGGNTTFGSWVTAYGGGGGLQGAAAATLNGGGSAGWSSAGNGATGGTGGGQSGINGGAATPSTPVNTWAGGAGNGVDTSNVGGPGASAFNGGGGGGGTGASGTGAGGSSIGGGAGGAANSGTNGVTGSQPGGGGGANRNGGNSGAGGAGKVVVSCW